MPKLRPEFGMHKTARIGVGSKEKWLERGVFTWGRDPVGPGDPGTGAAVEPDRS